MELLKIKRFPPGEDIIGKFILHGVVFILTNKGLYKLKGNTRNEQT